MMFSQGNQENMNWNTGPLSHPYSVLAVLLGANLNYLQFLEQPYKPGRIIPPF